MKTISSRDNPIVHTYRELASEADANGARLLLDGVHLVRDAHAARLDFESVAVAASRLTEETEEAEVARALEAAGVPVPSPRRVPQRSQRRFPAAGCNRGMRRWRR